MCFLASKCPLQFVSAFSIYPKIALPYFGFSRFRDFKSCSPLSLAATLVHEARCLSDLSSLSGARHKVGQFSTTPARLFAPTKRKRSALGCGNPLSQPYKTLPGAQNQTSLQAAPCQAAPLQFWNLSPATRLRRTQLPSERKKAPAAFTPEAFS